MTDAPRYVMLRLGDTIEDGDEFYDYGWSLINERGLVGETVTHHDHPIRRPVGQASDDEPDTAAIRKAFDAGVKTGEEQMRAACKEAIANELVGTLYLSKLTQCVAAIDALPPAPAMTLADAARVPEIAALIDELARSAQGWENVLEFGIVPDRYTSTAQALRDGARAALRAIAGGET